MSKPTMEDILSHLKQTEHLEDELKSDGTCRYCQAIRALILASDKVPEVSRGFVINSARAMGAAPDALAMVLEEAGVQVKEKP